MSAEEYTEREKEVLTIITTTIYKQLVDLVFDEIDKGTWEKRIFRNTYHEHSLSINKY